MLIGPSFTIGGFAALRRAVRSGLAERDPSPVDRAARARIAAFVVIVLNRLFGTR